MHGYGRAVNAVNIDPSAIASRRCGGVIAEQRLAIQGIVPNHPEEVPKRLDGACEIAQELSPGVRRRMTAWLDIALAPATVRRSLRVAMVVGSILVAINYGDRIIAGSLGTREFAKIALTYCVPYCVATYAAVSALLGAKRAS